MELFITIAKIILSILPFLNRKSKIKGEWIAIYHEQTNGKETKETVVVNQLWSLVWGNISPRENLNDPSWKFNGIIRDQVLVGIYFAKEKFQHWQGSFTLKWDNTKNKLFGIYSGFEESSQKIISSDYSWVKRNDLINQNDK